MYTINVQWLKLNEYFACFLLVQLQNAIFIETLHKKLTWSIINSSVFIVMILVMWFIPTTYLI